MKAHHQIFFSLLIGFALVSFWRGAWGLMDLYLFPENIVFSLWISVALGIAILVATNYATKQLM